MNIVFEGIDASGKTTIINKLKEIFDTNNVDSQIIADIKEPTPLLPVFENMFNSNFLELNENFKTSIYQTLLFACSHFYVQEKNKNNKHITIYDRDIFTLLSYQKEFLRQEYPNNYNDFYKPFKEMLMFENKQIDMLVYVSIPLEENIQRKIKRDGLMFSEEEKQKLTTFKKNMEAEIKNYTKQHPNTIVLNLDGREDPLTNCKKILESLQKNKIKESGNNNEEIF